jgi:hypothetical protein
MIKTCWIIEGSPVLFSLCNFLITTITTFKPNLKCCWTVWSTLLSWPLLRPFCRVFARVIYTECPRSIQILAERSLHDHRFQISSYAQIVNLGLAVFPEHVTPNLAPLHLVPDSSSLTLDYQVWSHMNLLSCRKNLNISETLVSECWQLSFRCSATVSSLIIWSIWVFVMHVLLVEQAYECVTYENSNFSDGELDTQHSEWFRWF